MAMYLIVVLLSLFGLASSFPSFAYGNMKSRRHGERFRFNVNQNVCNNLPAKDTCPQIAIGCSNARIFRSMELDDITTYLGCTKFGTSFILADDNSMQFFDGPDCVTPNAAKKFVNDEGFFNLFVCGSTVASIDTKGKTEVETRANLIFPEPPEQPSGPTASSASVVESFFD